MSKHTPGPWQTLAEELNRPYIRVRGTRLGERYKIANVLAPVYEGVHNREADETRANALLIAAAPMMYEALKQIEPILARMYGPQATELPPMQIIRAAIAEAEGA